VLNVIYYVVRGKVVKVVNRSWRNSNDGDLDRSSADVVVMDLGFVKRRVVTKIDENPSSLLGRRIEGISRTSTALREYTVLLQIGISRDVRQLLFSLFR
jgi:hypothetical protein